MKKIIAIIVVSIAVIFSCSDDFLDKPSQGSLDVPENAEGVDLLLTAAYGLLDGVTQGTVGNEWWGAGDNWWVEALSDNSHKGSENNDQELLNDLQLYNWDASNSYFLGKWLALYGGIDRTNTVINFASRITGDFPAQVAEARFLRGHYHFELQRLYQNVPYIGEEDIFDPNKPNEGPIWDEIEADFQFAIENLPNTQDLPGRATRWAALAYKGKVHLYQQEWDEALPLFDEVITDGPHALHPNFISNFNFPDKNGIESIFSIQFAVNDGAPNNFNGNQGGTLNFPSAFGYCCGFYQPTQDLVNTFKTDGAGLPLLDTYSETDVTNDQGIESEDPFTPYAGELDPRLDFTVGRRGIEYNGFGVHIGKDWIRKQSDGGPYLPKKNVYQSDESDAQGTGAWGQQFPGINHNVIRYADVLLMAAEAAAELNELTKALEYVNEVRLRAKTTERVQAPGGGDAANYEVEPYGNFPDQAFAIKAVRFERRLELAMEGHRLFDLRRWGNAVEVMNEFFENESRLLPEAFINSTYMEKHNLFPIPTNAIDLSEGVLKQHSVW
ncbi:RagB/SusD family nutrient uptake outer membrane protein [Fulvivirga sp. M361]|uniref:RagB/SusD family nutrient uptake outer membrane protein n=1 Tax=Fulvivirga sp. M361 TaxID=2594266 RepID=UPI00117A2FAF|nr:RagB/SusD family nutrient uptake outer membrane protein [Fulvivirga sp. M361]TRX61339.1 RagB/SusD family nutrient uptake outer membrane protein [Fulvivirga sp. M361]